MINCTSIIDDKFTFGDSLHLGIFWNKFRVFRFRILIFLSLLYFRSPIIGPVAEWLGRALQKLLQRFESARDLKAKETKPFAFLIWYGIQNGSVCLLFCSFWGHASCHGPFMQTSTSLSTLSLLKETCMENQASSC